MISVKQIRAARGLLNWNQSDLARHCGISVTAMNNIDRGLSTPRDSTLQKMQRIFESHGVKFSEGHGVCLLDDIFIVKSYEGGDALARYFDDIFNTLREQGGEALHIVYDEMAFITNMGERKAIFEFYRKARQYGFREKIMQAEGVMRKYAPPDCTQYRWCSKELAGQIGISIFGNKYSIFLPDKIVTIENPSVADAFRKQYYHNWKRARPMPSCISVFEKDLKRFGEK